MTNLLDRRVRKLEASAKAGEAELAVRIAFIRPGQDSEEEIAKQLGELRPRDIVVTFVRAAGEQPSGTLQ